MNEWNIQSRAHGCQACGKPFADKQPYHTLLVTEKSELKRMDVCVSCWAEQYQHSTDRKGFISYWQGVYEAPPPAPPEAIQKENAETLLRKLIQLNDPKHGAACFILAVMLERKRILKVKEQFKNEGKRVFVYEQPKTGDIFTITDPDLQLNQLDEVQRDVSNLLEHGLPQAEAAVVSAEPPANDAAVSVAVTETTSSESATVSEGAVEIAGTSAAEGGEPTPSQGH